MIFDKSKLEVGCPVHYFDHKKRAYENTHISSEVLTYRNEDACCVLSQKEPIQVKYLYQGHRKDIPMYFSAPKDANSPCNELFSLELPEGTKRIVITRGRAQLPDTTLANIQINNTDKFITGLKR